MVQNLFHRDEYSVIDMSKWFFRKNSVVAILSNNQSFGFSFQDVIFGIVCTFSSSGGGCSFTRWWSSRSRSATPEGPARPSWIWQSWFGILTLSQWNPRAGPRWCGPSACGWRAWWRGCLGTRRRSRTSWRCLPRAAGENYSSKRIQ